MEGREPYGEPAEMPDGREQDGDAREGAADAREREHDIREGVLDRWERELTERANTLNMLDDADEAALDHARQLRAVAHRRRRADAEHRHDAAIERAVRRSGASGGITGSDAAAHLDTRTRRALDRLTTLVVNSGTLDDTLTAILDIATDAFAEAAAVSVSLTIDGQLQPAASTTSWAANLDAAQIRDQAGPIADAVAGRTVVVSADLSDDDRWKLAESVGADASRGALSAAIVVGDEVSGVVSVYATSGSGFDSHAMLTAGMLAAQASLAVGWHLERRNHRAQTEAWERALASRDQIGQAKGILMEQNGLTAEQAFDLMRTTSQGHNTKVRAIAEHVVTHRRLPDPP